MADIGEVDVTTSVESLVALAREHLPLHDRVEYTLRDEQTARLLHPESTILEVARAEEISLSVLPDPRLG